ncbi:MAG: DUF2703 domain-containing protein [Bacillota bacterium]
MEEIINIKFLYLDLSVCERCKGTDKVIKEVIELLNPVLKMTNRKIKLEKINIKNKEMAKTHKFYSSPTIKVNGIDIQKNINENDCKDCGDLCGESVDCRTWSYKGKNYNSPPKALIIDSILQVIYCNIQPDKKDYKCPENLISYFDNLEKNKNIKKL